MPPSTDHNYTVHIHAPIECVTMCQERRPTLRADPNGLMNPPMHDTPPPATDLLTQRFHLEKGWLDLDRGALSTPSEVIALTPIEVSLLRVLIGRDGRSVSRDALHAEVWGYHPRVLSRAADQAVKRLRKKIELDPTAPTHLQTAHGVGYRFLLPDDAPHPPVHAELRTGCPTNLRGPPILLEGRQRVLAKLDRWHVGDGRLATLLGPGGIGKTAVARAWGEILLDTGPALSGGIWFSDLVDIEVSALMMARVARDVGLKMEGTVDATAVGEALSARGPTLLILDNLDPLVPVARHVLTEWLNQAPELAILVTSSVRIGVAEETCIQVAPLDVAASAALLKRRIDVISGRAHPPDAIAALAQALEGIPLAIELAAARCSLLSPREVHDRLNQRLDVLTRVGGDAAHRHNTLRAALSLSWSLLAPHEQDLLRQCLVFRGGFDLEAAEGVLQAAQDNPGVLTTLQRLRDHSLIHLAPGPGPTRVSLLEYVRDFVMEQPPQHDEVELRARHAAFFVDRCESVLRSDDLGIWCANAPLEPDIDNLRAAAERAPEFTDTLAVRVGLAAGRAMFGRGRADEIVTMTRAALDRAQAAESIPPHLLSLVLRRIGRDTLDSTKADEGFSALRAAIALADTHTLYRDAVLSRIDLGRSLYERGDFDEAMALVNQNASIATQHVPDLLPLVVHQRSRIYGHSGDLVTAEAHARTALGEWRRVGNRPGEALAHYTLGYIALEGGDTENAETEFKAAIEAFDEHGDDRAAALHNLIGVVAVQQGQLDRAAHIIESSIEWCMRTGRLHFLAEDLTVLGEIALLRGVDSDACQHLERAVELFQRGSDVHKVFDSQLILGLALVRSGRVATGRARLAECHAMQADARLPDKTALVDIVEALIDHATGKDGALERLRQTCADAEDKQSATTTTRRTCLRLAEGVLAAADDESAT
jgi:predicted ATPase/DNA-binding winged helix-turn-helix (wHTH) protein